ncbi:MAG: hypothetical protein ACRD1X_13805 [Vicinamibacteria bacterium]
MKPKKQLTLEDLGAVIQRGFHETAKQVEVNRRFGLIEDRLDRIEKFVLADHRHRIERLEDELKDLKSLLAIK